MNRDTLTRLWEAHKADDWPADCGLLEGPLMTLDTVISGCVVYYLESPDGLDESRRDIVDDCLTELESFEPDLGESSARYFQRLRELAVLLLNSHGR